MIRRAARALVDGRRLRRFITVGILGASVDLSVSVSLVLLTAIPPEVAKFLGAELAIIIMFVVNDRWTFRDIETRDGWHWLRRLIKSNLVRGGGLLVQVIVVFILTRIGVTMYVGETDIWPAVTMPIAIACGFIVNYTGETLITWRAYR